jgi:hypothetical protein
MSVTTGQHPGRRSTRSNGWRSTTKRSKVQFGGCVWLGGGEDRPAWGTPPAPTRNWPDTLADANWSVVKSRGVGVGRERTFRFGTCGPVFHSEPSLCGGEVPPFPSRFLPAPDIAGSASNSKERLGSAGSGPSCCAVTPSACGWVSGRKTALVVTSGG